VKFQVKVFCGSVDLNTKQSKILNAGTLTLKGSLKLKSIYRGTLNQGALIGVPPHKPTKSKITSVLKFNNSGTFLLHFAEVQY
jgi:hypothetical protein